MILVLREEKINLLALENKRGKLEIEVGVLLHKIENTEGISLRKLPRNRSFVAPAAGVFVAMPQVVFGEFPLVAYWCLPPVLPVGLLCFADDPARFLLVPSVVGRFFFTLCRQYSFFLHFAASKRKKTLNQTRKVKPKVVREHFFN